MVSLVYKQYKCIKGRIVRYIVRYNTTTTNQYVCIYMYVLGYMNTIYYLEEKRRSGIYNWKPYPKN